MRGVSAYVAYRRNERQPHRAYLTAKAVPTQIKHFEVLQSRRHFCPEGLS
ncbi:hypothetical protein C4J98_4124 [Pseudomonas orientalis]|nr:hypothetical protein C4J98_4124 [Pseudomonas orientalis]